MANFGTSLGSSNEPLLFSDFGGSCFWCASRINELIVNLAGAGHHFHVASCAHSFHFHSFPFSKTAILLLNTLLWFKLVWKPKRRLGFAIVQLAAANEKIAMQKELREGKMCKFGLACDAEKCSFQHPKGWADPGQIMNDENNPVCKFGETCRRKNPTHRRNFFHPLQDSLSLHKKTLGLKRQLVPPVERCESQGSEDTSNNEIFYFTDRAMCPSIPEPVKSNTKIMSAPEVSKLIRSVPEVQSYLASL